MENVSRLNYRHLRDCALQDIQEPWEHSFQVISKSLPITLSLRATKNRKDKLSSNPWTLRSGKSSAKLSPLVLGFFNEIPEEKLLQVASQALL